ncbi:acyl-CoA dehydrogenase family protein [Isosphaeraceae bacterium EP7]
MDFNLSDSQTTWQNAAIAFAREHLNDDLAGRDERREFWREGWRLCGEFGLQGLPIPEEYGGKGLGLPETIAAMEGMGYACPDSGLIFGINATLWTVSIPILKYGTEDQKRRWLPSLCQGKLVGANGASEPEAGSDIFSMQASAAKVDGGWVLNGRKTWITAGPVADVFVCYATTDPSKGILGVTAFIVPADTPGFRVVREIFKMGVRTVPMGEVAMEDCRLPDDALLGRVGRGAEVFNVSMEWERGSILAASLGTMKRQLEQCVAHARKRKQFGKAIGKFQAVSHRIVDMAVRLETSRHLVYKIGWLKEQGKDATTEAAMAKLYVSESYVQNSLEAVQTFGAAGYVAETGLERILRDSVGSLIYSGTNDIQRNIVAQRLGL